MALEINLYTFEPYVWVRHDDKFNHVSHECGVYLINSRPYDSRYQSFRELVFTADLPDVYFERYSGYSQRELEDEVMKQFAEKLREVLL